jgi:hypothetical protein
VADTKQPTKLTANNDSDLSAVLRRARSGDESALPALRRVLDTGELVESLGNLALQVEATLIKNAAGENLAFKEGLGRKMAKIRADLAGPDAPPLERLLADRVAVCWLSLHDVEVRFAQSCNDLTIKQADYWQRRINSAHKRYLTAIKTLATVRKLALLALQVNIARKQVNVVAPGG